MKVRFEIPGPPAGKGRPRFRKAGNRVMTYTPEQTVDYENLVKLMYCHHCKNYRFADTAPLDVRIIAYFPIPKSKPKKVQEAMRNNQIRPTIKIDWDNIGKIVCDALNDIAYHDDKQVVDAQVRKFYSDNPKVVVTIREAEVAANE